MYIKIIQIIFAFIALALMALSSPISSNFDIDEYYSNKSNEHKILMARNEEQNSVLSDEEATETFQVNDCDSEILENDSDSEVEEVTENPENNDNYVYSNNEQLSYNWNRSPEEIVNMVNKHIVEMSQIVAQIENIPDEECSFEFVVVPIERKIFNPTMDLFLQTSLSSFHPSEEIRSVTGNNVTSIIGQFQMGFFLNKNIYHKFLMVGENIENGKFEGPKTAEDQRLIDYYEKTFRRNGVTLTDEQLEEYMNVFMQINYLSSQFSQCITNDNTVISFNKQELEGLNNLDGFEKSIRDGEEIYSLDLKNPKCYDIISSAKNDNVRKTFLTTVNQRCPSNIEIIKKLLSLRLREAQLLGYKSYAHFKLEDQMAKNPDNVFKFLNNLEEKLKPIGEKAIQKLLELKKEEKVELNEPVDNKLNNWDIAYYNRILSEKTNNLNNEEIKKYFPLNDILPDILNIYETVLSVKCIEVMNPNVWHSDVREFNVYDSKTKKLLGVLYLDLFPREGKSSGYTKPFSLQYKKEDGSSNIPSGGVFLNFEPPLPNKPTLLTHDGLCVLLHELGHAFHGSVSDIKWENLGVLNIEHDFIEVPSQMAENWCWEPEIIEKLSRHYQDNNKKMPKDLIESIIKNRNSGKAIDELYNIAYSMIDMKLHTIEEFDENIDIVSLWNKEEKEITSIDNIEDNWRIATFSHLVEGYDAGYYGYLWDEVYSTDIYYSQFKKYGILSPEVGERYRNIVLKQGYTKDSMNLLTEFLGREPNEEAFITVMNS